jgi:ribulose-5-phosphate 4-epimerase/fuculose-1-phosphate aldolase
LAATFRLFALYDFDQGLAGHVTARDPEWPDHFWVNPLGVYFGHIRVSDLLLVNQSGDIVQGDRPVNQAAFAIHAAIHQARPDVIAAAHTHATYGKAWSTLGRTLDPLSQDAAAFYDDHVLFDDYTGVVLEKAQGDRIAAALGQHKAAILRNHGLLTAGPSVEAAAWWYIAFENAARTQLLAEAAGTPKPLDHAVARHTATQVGSPEGGYFSFQPLWDRITREQPDLFD